MNFRVIYQMIKASCNERNIAHVTSCYKRQQPWLRNMKSCKNFMKKKDIPIEILFIFTFRSCTDSRMLFRWKGISEVAEQSTSLFSWLFSEKTPALTVINFDITCIEVNLWNIWKVEQKSQIAFIWLRVSLLPPLQNNNSLREDRNVTNKCGRKSTESAKWKKAPLQTNSDSLRFFIVLASTLSPSPCCCNIKLLKSTATTIASVASKEYR